MIKEWILPNKSPEFEPHSFPNLKKKKIALCCRQYGTRERSNKSIKTTGPVCQQFHINILTSVCQTTLEVWTLKEVALL